MFLQKNIKSFLIFFSLAVGMVGLSYLSVPLYDLFCRVTGFGGTTSVAVESSSVPILDKKITIRFDANVNKDLQWSFGPEKRSLDVYIGEENIIYYKAKNIGKQASVGTSTFNVTPHKSGNYFVKIECFCFNEQRLEAKEEILMPVKFYVEPDIIDDALMDNVNEITLSYSFFKVQQKG